MWIPLNCRRRSSVGGGWRLAYCASLSSISLWWYVRCAQHKRHSWKLVAAFLRFKTKSRNQIATWDLCDGFRDKHIYLYERVKHVESVYSLSVWVRVRVCMCHAFANGRADFIAKFNSKEVCTHWAMWRIDRIKHGEREWKWKKKERAMNESKRWRLKKKERDIMNYYGYFRTAPQCVCSLVCVCVCAFIPYFICFSVLVN